MAVDVLETRSKIKAQDATAAGRGLAGGADVFSHLYKIGRSVEALTNMTAITFPQGLGDDPHQPFFMTFQPKKITTAVGGTMGDMGFEATVATKDKIAQVALPIPTGINTAYAQAWDQTDVNALQGALLQSSAVQAAAKTIKGQLGENYTVRDAMNKGKDIWQGGVTAGPNSPGGPQRSGGLSGGIDFGEIGAAISSGGQGAISTLMSKIPTMGISGNTLAGVALGTAGKLLGPAMSTATGFASFNQMMAHYQGPAFRNFNFTFTLRPLDPRDQKNIVKIVNFFKIASAPSQISNGLFRIYELPYVFKIGFWSRKGELQDVNKIAHCACLNVTVTYGGDRFQTFSGTDSPVETNIVLSFKEIELLNRQNLEDGF